MDKLERDPRIRFNLIQWANRQVSTGVPGPKDWYIPLCVKHNLHPTTGEPRPPWKGKNECVQRLTEAGHDHGVWWVPGDDVGTLFSKYTYNVRVGSMALDVAKWQTIHEEEHRRAVWVLSEDIEPDPDFRVLSRPDPDIIRALELKYLRDRNLLP